LDSKADLHSFYLVILPSVHRHRPHEAVGYLRMIYNASRKRLTLCVPQILDVFQRIVSKEIRQSCQRCSESVAGRMECISPQRCPLRVQVMAVDADFVVQVFAFYELLKSLFGCYLVCHAGNERESEDVLQLGKVGSTELISNWLCLAVLSVSLLFRVLNW
jgi:hypothetical protein